MEQNKPKFRLRLNLFDALVLVAVLAVGAFLLWNALKPQAPVEVMPTPRWFGIPSALSTGPRGTAGWFSPATC